MPSNVAYHEASHVVCMLVLGFSVDRVSVRPHRRDDGIVDPGHVVSRGRRGSRAGALAALAGTVGEFIATGDTSLEPAGEDLRQADDFARRCRPPGVDPQAHNFRLWRQAERLLRQHWPDVEALAEELDRRGEMDAREIDRFLRGTWER